LTGIQTYPTGQDVDNDSALKEGLLDKNYGIVHTFSSLVLMFLSIQLKYSSLKMMET